MTGRLIGALVLATGGALAIPLVHQSGPGSARRSIDRPGPPAASPPGHHAVAPALARMRSPFIENRGQADARVRFSASTRHGMVAVTARGALIYSTPAAPPDRGARAVALTEEFVGAERLTPTGLRRAPTRVNVFHGSDPAKWQRDLAAYDAIGLGEAFSGIDVRLEASAGSVEKIFTVRPGADPTHIRVRITGADALRITAGGELEADTANGPARFSRPIAYQEDQGGRTAVDVAYAVDDGEYGFRLGTYDRQRPLVIDPALVSTYLGGSAILDGAFAVLPDSAGNVYVAGWTASLDFPGVGAGSPDSVAVGCNNLEAFVAKLDPGLTTVLSATYLGGINLGYEHAFGLALNPQGDVYVAGDSPAPDFPGISTASPDATALGQEAFVVRLDSNLANILSATFIGGSGDDVAYAVGYEPVTDLVYVAGRTQSTDLPGVGPLSPDAQLQGGSEGFVVALTPALDVIVGGSFLGGSGAGSPAGDLTAIDAIAETAHDVAFDEAGNVYVTGVTDSPDFPQIGAGDVTFAGPSEAFVVKLGPGLSSVLGGTFLGGAGAEQGRRIAYDPASLSLYVAGVTSSPDFPGVVPGAVADSEIVGKDAFVSRLDASLSLFASSFYGGDGDEIAEGLVMAADGTSLYLGGDAAKTAWGPSQGGVPGIGPGAADPVYQGISEGFVARLDPALSSLQGATFVGGHQFDHVADMAVHGDGAIYVAGMTGSTAFPGAGAFSADPAMGASENDAFVTRVNSVDASWTASIQTVFVFITERFSPSDPPDRAIRRVVDLLTRAQGDAARGRFRASIAQAEQAARLLERLVARDSSADLRALNALVGQLLVDLREMIPTRAVPGPRRPPGPQPPACPAPIGPAARVARR